MRLRKSLTSIFLALAIPCTVAPLAVHANPLDSLRRTIDPLNLQGLPGAKSQPLAKAVNAGWDAAKQQQFDLDITAALAIADVPGAAIAVIKDGRIVSLKAYGVKEKSGLDRVRTDSQFMIGSVSKPITTTLMAGIVSEGRASWDTPAKQLYPPFRIADPALSNTVTLRNLVCNCIATERRDYEILLNGDKLNAERIVDSVRSYALQQPPGQRFEYNNQLVASGGFIAALAAGGQQGDLFKNYQRALHARLLEPIGMRNTTLSLDRVMARWNFAQPHGLTLNYEQVPIDASLNNWATAIAPGGGMWSTVEDMAQYALTQLNRGVAPNGTRIAAAKELETTWTPQVAINDAAAYGLGWFTSTFQGKRVVFHGGNVYGFSAEVAFLPDDGVAVIALSNADNSILPAFARARALELLFDLPNQNTAAALSQYQLQAGNTYRTVSALSTTVPEADVAAFVGSYENTDLGRVKLRFNDGIFSIDVGEFETELVKFVQPGSGEIIYVTKDPPLALVAITLQREANGQPTFTLNTPQRAYVFSAR
jgi:CubicO group peptidase (beta-lactamase class C family)